jgi:hypothetical protein
VCRGSDHDLLIFHVTVPERWRKLKPQCAQTAIVESYKVHLLSECYIKVRLLLHRKHATNLLILYFSVLLHWLMLQYAETVLKVQLLVVHVVCYTVTFYKCYFYDMFQPHRVDNFT